MPQKKLKIFDKNPAITANVINQRLQNMEKVAGFKCETEEHRKARYALFKNMSRYESAVKVLQNMLEKEAPEHEQYRKEKIKLMKDCGAKEQTHPEVGSYYNENTIKYEDRYRKGLQKLEEKYADAIAAEEERKQRNKELGEMEIEDVPTPFYTEADYFPNSVSPKDMASIAFMIRDPEKQSPKRTKKTKSKDDE